MDFLPGLQLSELFFKQAIQPLMADSFPNLPYTAARLDFGSDVLGLDTPMSMDHGWGPKMTLFLTEDDHRNYQQKLDTFFAHHLPFSINGFPTHFGEPLADGGVMMYKDTYPIRHKINIITLDKFFAGYLGVDIQHPLTPKVWLTIPQQRLCTVRAGKIYYDDLNMAALQKKFNWYPHDLWLYLMANQWQRIDQDEPFIGRTGSVGDELGCRLAAARLIRDLMRLVFLIEKQFAPYNKWFGSAFKQLDMAEVLSLIFNTILESNDWKARESLLSKAYLLLADKHNALGITPKIKPEVSHFYNRPFIVPHASRFVTALLAQITDPQVQVLPPHLGSLDQMVDNTDLLDNIPRCQKLRILYNTTQD